MASQIELSIANYSQSVQELIKELCGKTQVVADPNGKLGIWLFEKFLELNAPNIKLGDQIKYQVDAKTSSVILNLLSEDNYSAPHSESQIDRVLYSLKNTIKPEQVRSLKEFLALLDKQNPLLESSVEGVYPQGTEIRILDELITPTEVTIKLVNELKQLAKQTSKKPDEQNVEKTAPQLSSPQRRFLSTLTETLEILGNGASKHQHNSREVDQAEFLGRLALRLTLEANLLALDSSNAKVLEQLKTNLKNLNFSKDPILVLYETMISVLPTFPDKKNAAETALYEELKLISQQLKNLKEDKVSEKDLKSILEKTKKNLIKIGNGDLANDENNSIGRSARQEINQINEALGTLNPIMQALGEPAVYVLPSMFPGLISAIVMTVHFHAPGPGGHKKQTKQTAPVSIKLFTNFSQLGPVAAEIMLNKPEARVLLCVQNPAVRDYIDQRLGRLEGSLRMSGYSVFKLSSELSHPKPPVPSWCKTIVKGLTIA